MTSACPHDRRPACELDLEQCRQVMDWLVARGQVIEQLVAVGLLEAGEALLVIAPYLERGQEIQARTASLARSNDNLI